MNLNIVFAIGRLTRDPEMRALPSGVQVCSFSLAVNRTFKGKDGEKQEQTEFINVVVFGKQADTSAQYLRKGSEALVEGRLQTRSWEKDGAKQYRTEIVADRIQFGNRPGNGQNGTSSARGAEDGAVVDEDAQAHPPLAGGGKKAPSETEIQYPTEDINPDDIPF